MGLYANFHGKVFSAQSRNFTANNPEPFCTFEVMSEGNTVIVYLKSLEDADRILDAAEEARRNVKAMLLEKKIDEDLLTESEV